MTDPTKLDYTDYWLNRNLSGVLWKNLAFPERTILLGDGNDGTDATNARYNRSRLPPTWFTAPNSPANRHQGGANYAFTDGHVKMLKPEQITTVLPAPGVYTFAIK